LGCDTLSLPHFLDNRLTDGCEVVSSTRRPPFTPQESSWYSICWRLGRTQGHSEAGRIRSIEKSNDIGNRNLDLPGCSIVPQPTTLPRAPLISCTPTKSNLQCAYPFLVFSLLTCNLLFKTFKRLKRQNFFSITGVCTLLVSTNVGHLQMSLKLLMKQLYFRP
jgi:hypothetical protein